MWGFSWDWEEGKEEAEEVGEGSEGGRERGVGMDWRGDCM
jgi:hypothetical protein